MFRLAGQDWSDQAACRGHDPELFFPIGEGPAAQLQIAEAKAVCAGCPVTWECLAEAYRRPKTVGIWAGTTEDERRKLRELSYEQRREDGLILPA